jgi:hypothetical protein
MTVTELKLDLDRVGANSPEFLSSHTHTHNAYFLLCLFHSVVVHYMHAGCLSGIVGFTIFLHVSVDTLLIISETVRLVNLKFSRYGSVQIPSPALFMTHH